MTHTFSIQYYACQSCVAKIHCSECDQKFKEALEKNPEIQKAEFQMMQKKAIIQSDFMTEDELIDLLEDEGIFAD